MAKQYLRKKQLAARYQTTDRTIERMVDDGRIPSPDLYNGRFPLWDEAKLDENDRVAAARPRPSRPCVAVKQVEHAT